MHSRVGWWSEQSILWYERASGRTVFHERLADVIEPFLGKGERIAEAGCGLGYEAEILRGRGHDIQGYDMDPLVIEAASKRSGLKIFHCADIDSIAERPGVLLCINFGHIDSLEDLDLMLDRTCKRLVYVVSRHSGHGVETRKDRSSAIEALLRERALEYTRSDFSLEFDQPLKSLDEARAFIDWTYLGNSIEKYMAFVERTEDGEYPFVFKNRKSMVQFVIDK